MTELYERIIAYTEEIGLSGNELGKLLGLKKSPLTDWKNKKSNPTLEQLKKMCEIFAISSDYLLFGETNTLSNDETKLIEYYHEMSKNDKEDFLLIAEMKANKAKREKETILFHSKENLTTTESA